MKKVFILLALITLLSNIVYSSINEGYKIDNIISHYKKMSLSQLFEKGNEFVANSVDDSALICYSLIYNSRILKEDKLSQEISCKALCGAAQIYYDNCDYKYSVELLLKAKNLCENIDYKEYMGYIYNSIGNIHYRFKDYKLAKKYYELAHGQENDNVLSARIMSNLCMIAYEENEVDSALLMLKETYKVCLENSQPLQHSELNNIATIYQLLKDYDTAYYYYRLALRNARQFNKGISESNILSGLGLLYLEQKQYDSAKYYFEQSNVIAHRLKLLDILSMNFLQLSKMEEERHHIREAFDYYKQYSSTHDSLFDATKYAKINELQFVHDMKKVEQQVEQLNIEQEIKERTITIQRRLQLVMGLILFIVIASLITLYNKNKTINQAYNRLVSRNIEIINSDKLNEKLKLNYENRLRDNELLINEMREKLERNSTVLKENDKSIKYRNSSLNNDSKSKLTAEIFRIINDKNIVCDSGFSIDKLVKMVGSNHTYVSQILNDEFKKSFYTLVNEYRIKESCHILSSPECEKYSIDAISKMVGFKHKSTFNPLFKQIIGVTPSFYLKSVRNT